MKEAERLEKAFKRKALATYRAADSLVNANPNSAANRAYYCLYQVLVGEFERLGIHPQSIDAGSARASQDDIRLKWTHSFIKNNASLAQLTARQCAAVRRAYDFRTIADYNDADVLEQDVVCLLKDVRDILEGLGIKLEP